jgi:AcrR family transcriptional regulator
LSRVKSPKSNHRREQIIHAAAKLFREFGFNGTSVEEIAKEVNLPKGGIYNHIKSKEELLYQIITHAIVQFLPVLREIKASRDDLKVKFRQAVYTDVFSLATHHEWVSVFLQDRKALSRKHYLKYLHYRDEVEETFRDIIKQGMKAGVFRKADLNLTTFAILGMCNSVIQWYRPGGRVSAHKIAEFFAKAAENMVHL